MLEKSLRLTATPCLRPNLCDEPPPPPLLMASDSMPAPGSDSVARLLAAFLGPPCASPQTCAPRTERSIVCGDFTSAYGSTVMSSINEKQMSGHTVLICDPPAIEVRKLVVS